MTDIPEDLEKFRYEKKAIVELDKSEMEDVIKHNPAFFSELFHERKVNNIYFDSLNFNNYSEHISGNTNRLKIRIRWYGEIFGKIEKPVLEIKIKRGQLGRKISFPLKSFTFDKTFSQRFFKREIISKSDLPSWLCEILLSNSPTLLNSYKRKYFISKDKKYRITLDSDFLFLKIESSNNLFAEKIVNKEILILELKYNQEAHSGAHFLTQHFPFRFEASSKYIIGLNLLNLV